MRRENLTIISRTTCIYNALTPLQGELNMYVLIIYIYIKATRLKGRLIFEDHAEAQICIS